MGAWRKSSYSGGNGGDCVEAADRSGVILVRDTADRQGLALAVPADAWEKFTASLRQGARTSGPARP
jgi:hypothetical protein